MKKVTANLRSRNARSLDRSDFRDLSPVCAGVLGKLGLEADNPGAFCGEWLGSGAPLKSISPIDGKALATVRTATAQEYERTVERARAAFHEWENVPAPKRGELVRQLGNALRAAKHD